MSLSNPAGDAKIGGEQNRSDTRTRLWYRNSVRKAEESRSVCRLSENQYLLPLLNSTYGTGTRSGNVPPLDRRARARSWDTCELTGESAVTHA